MVIERTKEEIIIRLPATIDVEELQGFIDFARYKELTSDFEIEQSEVDAFAKDINKSWWQKNRKKLVK